MNGKFDNFLDSVDFWINSFLIEITAKNYSKNTISLYKRQILKFSDFLYENYDNYEWKTLIDLKQMHLYAFFVWLEEDIFKNTKEIIKNSTKKSYYRVISVFFRFINRNNDNLWDFDYLFQGFKLKVKKDTKKSVNFIQSDDITKILNYLEKKMNENPSYMNYRNSLLVKLMCKAGLRVSEALNLKLKDIEECEDDCYELSILAKGGNIQTAFIAKAYIESEMQYLEAILKSDDYVFLTHNGTRLTRENVYKTLDNVYKNSLVKARGCHILRHSFAVEMVQNNTNLIVIQKALRHKKLDTTLIYAEADNRIVRKEVARL
ncbi:tyrosine-type recombinase/integrase [Campylobacter sp. JMF_01 NE2]|uniref:tyrosine-type recombinase/integrase n=1 Tax=unclassified Campylobacter TaxID=2593542 RepID=UPI0022E9E6D5|nr:MULTISPECIES: tyrosine-type recombinase/integrase [unclassified Campylobacter]MDA3053338.1 tyrosine-type recombinase/integrase [Campylobacter sp. JMF_03 NE3]MDA3067642.1 tyrosine-type recombinase/integrase [Campylobacter sp. JMF_01 NE2]